MIRKLRDLKLKANVTRTRKERKLPNFSYLWMKDVLFETKKNFYSFYQRLLHSATLLKKRLWHRCFPVSFGKFRRTPFLQNTSGRLLLIFDTFEITFIWKMEGCLLTIDSENAFDTVDQ